MRVKRIADIADKSQLEGLKLLLESKGIPVYVGNEASARNLGFLTPARGHSLWVVFDEQVEEALAVMDDPDHEVASPVDVAAYQREAGRLEEDALGRVFRGVMLAGVAVVVVVGILFYLLAGAPV